MKNKKYILFLLLVATILFCVVWVKKVLSPKVLGEELTIIRLEQYLNMEAVAFNRAVGVLKPNYFFQKTYYAFELNPEYLSVFWENNSFRRIGSSNLEGNLSLNQYFNEFDIQWDEFYILYQDDYAAKLFQINNNGLYFYIR